MGPENCIVGSVSPPGEEAYREDGGGGGVLGYGSDGGRWEEPNVLTWDTPLAAKGRERANSFLLLVPPETLLGAPKFGRMPCALLMGAPAL